MGLRGLPLVGIRGLPLVGIRGFRWLLLVVLWGLPLWAPSVGAQGAPSGGAWGSLWWGLGGSLLIDTFKTRLRILLPLLPPPPPPPTPTSLQVLECLQTLT